MNEQPDVAQLRTELNGIIGLIDKFIERTALLDHENEKRKLLLDDKEGDLKKMEVKITEDRALIEKEKALNNEKQKILESRKEKLDQKISEVNRILQDQAVV